MSDPQPRPGQATLAGALIIGGSIVLVLSAWQRISTLHTLEVQEWMERQISGAGGMGMSVETFSTMIRVACLVGAGAATASTILGFQVFKRSQSARMALTALSPLLLLGALATDGFLAPMVVAGIVLLWLQPTRDWYAGRPWVQRYDQRRAARVGGPAPDGDAGPSQPASPWSAPAPQPTDPAPSSGSSSGLSSDQPTAPWVDHRPQRRRETPRPGALIAGCVLAWAFSTITVAFLALTALALATQSDELYAEMQEQQPDLAAEVGKSELVASVSVMVGVLVVWAIVAIVLAGIAFVGHNWARVLLAISAAVAAVLSLALSFAAPPMVVLVLVFAVGAWLLLRPEVSAWYRR
ncbi:hypothetical protein ACFQ0K_10915 [Nocardioides caeni]|uniref:DUF4064 domain-containing protein n=1 Tax=Nocardioides caeni TaxID=574700 RepID=A0A4S8N1X3_9ACTN|nr:hypothetical protein [Nocardioides caeni]THV09913.1 hypothetical protein E9934_15430 [Nocardioides caeni]